MDPTPEQLREWKMAFELCDDDDDGEIISSDLGKLIRTIGYTPTQAYLQELEGEADMTYDSMVTFDNFVALLKEFPPTIKPAKDVLKAFEVFDVKKTGRVDASDFKQVMASLGEKLNAEELEEIMSLAAPGGAEFVDYRVFVGFMEKATSAPVKY